MGLVRKLEKVFASFVLVGNLFLGGCDNYRPPVPNPETEIIDAFPSQRIDEMREELRGKKLALTILSDYDFTCATGGMEERLDEDFKDMPEYVLYSTRANSLEKIFNNLRDYSTLKPVDALILAYHGDQNWINVNFFQEINRSNVRDLFKDYSSVFSKDAVILLYSCQTGKRLENIAISLADVLDRDVVAPKYVLIPEVNIEKDKRVGEFALDENGRVSFDYEKFRIYEQICFRGGRYESPLAVSSYESEKGDKVKGENGKDYFLVVDK